MEGHFRIRSERTPYRRAGLVFGQERVVEVSAIAIAAAQLVTLTQDPALRIEFWDGGYRPLSTILPAGGLTETHAEQLLERLRAKAEAADDDATEASPAGDDWALALATAQDELRQARDRISALETDLETADTRAGQLSDELTGTKGRIAELEGQLAGKGSEDGGAPAAVQETPPAAERQPPVPTPPAPSPAPAPTPKPAGRSARQAGGGKAKG